MAGEWIKVERGTAHKPEVLKLARKLGLDRDAVLGKLVRLWAWFDENSEDGTVRGVSPEDCNAFVTLDGFTEALRDVGWFDFDAEKELIWLPNFDRHNGKTAKTRAKNAKKVRDWRVSASCKTNGYADETKVKPKCNPSEVTNGLTKRREEKRRSNTPCSPPGDGEDSLLPELAADGSSLAELRRRLCAMFGHEGSLPKDAKVNTAWKALVQRCPISAVDVELLEFWYGQKKNPPPKLKGRFWARTSVLTLLRNWERDLAFVREAVEEIGGPEGARDEPVDEDDEQAAKRLIASGGPEVYQRKAWPEPPYPKFDRKKENENEEVHDE